MEQFSGFLLGISMCSWMVLFWKHFPNNQWALLLFPAVLCLFMSIFIHLEYN